MKIFNIFPFSYRPLLIRYIAINNMISKYFVEIEIAYKWNYSIHKIQFYFFELKKNRDLSLHLKTQDFDNGLSIMGCN